jgi:hypothetical protein
MVGEAKEITIPNELAADLEGVSWSEICGVATITLQGAPPFVTLTD